jgi:hypothetical protein
MAGGLQVCGRTQMQSLDEGHSLGLDAKQEGSLTQKAGSG